MNVLSLFDGMSCGQIALQRLGYKVDKYFACEIDKFAVKVSSTKFPDTIHLGDVTQVKAADLGRIDLLIGGSPCQGFSNAGKGLNFDDPRSKLFFEYVRLLKECRESNPNVIFLLENVRMKKEWEDIISRLLGIQPILINSTLVSAQNRERLYWTNLSTENRGLFGFDICAIPQPKDRGLYLRDILEAEVDEKYFLSEKALARLINVGVPLRHSVIDPEKSGAMIAGQYRNGNGTFVTEGVTNQNGQLSFVDKCTCIDANYAKGMDNHSQRTMVIHTEEIICRTGALSRKDGKAYCLDTSAQMAIELREVIAADYRHDEGFRPRKDGKTGTLLAQVSGGHCGQYAISTRYIRRLTPVECCRLQTVSDDYFYNEGKLIVSESQIYKMLGNGFTIEVIAHILSFFSPTVSGATCYMKK